MSEMTTPPVRVTPGLGFKDKTPLNPLTAMIGVSWEQITVNQVYLELVAENLVPVTLGFRI